MHKTQGANEEKSIFLQTPLPLILQVYLIKDKMKDFWPEQEKQLLFSIGRGLPSGGNGNLHIPSSSPGSRAGSNCIKIH